MSENSSTVLVPIDAGASDAFVANRDPRRFWRDSLRRRYLAAADAAALVAAAAVLALYAVGLGVTLLLTTPLWLVLAKACGLYDRDHQKLRHVTIDESAAIVVWTLGGAAIVTAILVLTRQQRLPPSGAAVFCVSFVVIAFAFRASARRLWRMCTPPERILVVGDGPTAGLTLRKLELFPQIHSELAGRVDRVEGVLERPALRLGADRILLATESLTEESVVALLPICRRNKIKLSVIPPARAYSEALCSSTHVADLPVLAYNTWDVTRSTLAAETRSSISVARPSRSSCSPALRCDRNRDQAWTAAARSCIAQRRAGLGGRPFRMYKFRTMVRTRSSGSGTRPDRRADRAGVQAPDDPRVTRVGRFLRRTSLDELTQLFNVVTGRYESRGPAPEAMEFVERYGPEHPSAWRSSPG